MTQTHVFEMAMTCEGCANAARRVLGKLGDGVTIESIDVSTKQIVVKTDKSADEIKTTLEKTGKAIKHLESR